MIILDSIGHVEIVVSGRISREDIRNLRYKVSPGSVEVKVTEAHLSGCRVCECNVEPLAGSRFDNNAKQSLLELARFFEVPVIFKWAGIAMVITAKDNLEDISRRFNQGRKNEDASDLIRNAAHSKNELQEEMGARASSPRPDSPLF